MFEDALVESSGKSKSQSRYWMAATFAFNLAILAMLVLIPLLHPEALPKMALTAMLTAPPPPPPAPPAIPVQQVKATRTVEPLNAMTAPSHVPKEIDLRSEPPRTLVDAGVASGAMNSGSVSAENIIGALATGTVPVVVNRPIERERKTGPVRLSSGVAAGSILTKTTPLYPAIAKAAHVSGAVVLHAVISKAGTIESLQVISGPEMLRGSALDAVRQWRYRPYLLNGEPTEVETAVTVNFSFGG